MVSSRPPAAAERKRRLPVFEGFTPIDHGRVPADLIAGITLAALGIPEVMGYATIAGMPVITGLYTILIPITVFCPARFVSPPGRRRRLGDGGNPRGGACGNRTDRVAATQGPSVRSGTGL